ncbi:MAG: hypothetical protein AAF495_08315 [Pseudomonadota bacterium]
MAKGNLAIRLGLLFVVLCLPFLKCAGAAEEPTPLSAAEIRDRLIGNTLVFHHRGEPLAGRYLAEDGTAEFDPLRGFRVPSHWSLDEEGDRLCFWDIDPDNIYCGRFLFDAGRYFIDWGGGINRDFYEIVEAGDTTDPSDNPGPDFRPNPDIPLPADLHIQPPDPTEAEPYAAFVGAWFGSFIWRDYLIIVETVEGSRAEVIYAFGPNLFFPDNPRWSRISVDIEEGELNLELVWGTINASLKDDGTMTAIFDWGNGAEWSRAIRWDDPSLAPQAPVEILAPDPAAARDKLAFWDVQMSRNLGEDPLHNAYFMPLGEAAPALHAFEGTLSVGSSKVLGRPAGSRGASDYGAFPRFSVDFVSHGNRLMPRDRGILETWRDGAHWNIILEPGRVWSEPGDNGWSRASFPFLLTDPQSGGGRNGLATFLFNDEEVSPLRFQVVKEATSRSHSDLWGQAALTYEPKRIDRRAEVISDFEQELADQVEIRPWSDLEARYGAALVAPFDGTAIRPKISHSALILDGEVYGTACRTRTGPYPYCREMRHGVFSVTKSLAGFLSLLRLAEKYGAEVLDLQITDYVEIDAEHDGWKDVTFEHALSMVTGVGDVEPTRVTHYVDAGFSDNEMAYWRAPSAQEKLNAISAIGNYPWGPGEVFRYVNSTPFVLGAAMDSFLKSKEGPDVHLWQMMNDEVFQPIGIHHLPAQHSLEEAGDAGLPLMAVGAFVTLDDIAKIERLIRNQGRHEGEQILHAGLLRESLAPGPGMAYPTGWENDQGEVSYFRSFWITPQKSQAGCIAPIPGMSGSGGNSVLLMPNGVTAVRFAGGDDDDPDSGTFDASHMRQVADDIRPLCVP